MRRRYAVLACRNLVCPSSRISLACRQAGRSQRIAASLESTVARQRPQYSHGYSSLPVLPERCAWLSCRATRRGATWNVSATESIFASIMSMRRIIPSSNCHSQQSDNLPRLPPARARAPTEPQG